MEEKEQNKTKQQRGKKNKPKKMKQVTRAIAMGAQKIKIKNKVN